ncbi:unnamed protein product, partial [Musa textilis]
TAQNGPKQAIFGRMSERRAVDSERSSGQFSAGASRLQLRLVRSFVQHARSFVRSFSTFAPALQHVRSCTAVMKHVPCLLVCLKSSMQTGTLQCSDGQFSAGASRLQLRLV